MFEALLIAQMSYQYLTDANFRLLSKKLYDPNWTNGRTLVELHFNQVNQLLGYYSLEGCNYSGIYSACTWKEGNRVIQINWMPGTDLVVSWRSEGF